VVKVEAEISFKNVRALQEIVQSAASEGLTDIVDAEIVDDKPTDTTQDTTQPSLA
jgi:hypothetical protein